MTTRTDDEPILASWKISEVLHQHPDLLDALVELSPAFAKLRNPLMRKVQSRLVTVAQAAEIAGIPPAELTRALNQAAGLTSAERTVEDRTDSTQAQPPPRPDWVETAQVVEVLDVRPAMARGEEPFHAIMKTASSVPPGSAFRLLVGFEPLPLYDALAKLGFDHWTSRRDDCWSVSFYRDREARQPRATPATSEPAMFDPNRDAATAEVSIDVSELVPPEPMIKILRALEALPADGRLLVHHVRRPIHLYDRLDEMGYVHETRELNPGQVEILIQKQPGASPT